jgi:hypothetical protein
MKTRLVEYFNTDTHAIEYGVSVYYKGRWCNLAVDGVAFIVKSPAKAEEKRAVLRKHRDVQISTPKEQPE